MTLFDECHFDYCDADVLDARVTGVAIADPV